MEKFQYIVVGGGLAGMHRALVLNRKVMRQPAFRALIKDELEPGFHVKFRADIHEYILEHVAGGYPPVDTCKIGAPNDPMAVADSQLRLFGISALGDSDGSVTPIITNSTSIMIGKRAASLRLATLTEGGMK